MKKKTLNFMIDTYEKDDTELDRILSEEESLSDDLRISKAELKKAIRSVSDYSFVEEEEIPSAYLLHIEVSGMTDEEKEFFKEHGLMESGISRDIVVPAMMSLRQLHYVIQRLFGLQEFMDHGFFLTDEDFKRLTANSVKRYLELCGSILRFQSIDTADNAYDSDYRNKQDFSKWLRGKYSTFDDYFAICETYIDNIIRVEGYLKFQEKKYGMPLTDDVKLSQRENLQDFMNAEIGHLLERLSMCDVFLTDPKKEFNVRKWKSTMMAFQKEANDSLNYYLKDNKREYYELEKYFNIMLQNRDCLFHALIEYNMNGNVKYENGKTLLDFIKKFMSIDKRLRKDMREEMDMANPVVMPFANELDYHYEKKGLWDFRITCIERYFYNDEGELIDSEGHVCENIGKRIDEGDGFTPICLYSDGPYLLEGEGGFHQYCQNLKEFSEETGSNLNDGSFGCDPSNCL